MARDTKHNEPDTTNVLHSLTAGAIAGALAKSTIAPLDRTKINFQISHEPYSVRAAFQFLVKTYANDGFIMLWRGNTATMTRIIPYAAIQFTAFEQWGKLLKVNSPNTEHKAVLKFLSGSLAGVTSQTLTYPLDLARARMAVTTKNEYGSLGDVFRKTYQIEGIKGFYRGYVPTILGIIPYAGTSFFTYGTLKIFIKEKHGYDNAVVNLACGAVAGMAGQSSSYPLDIIRRKMQTSIITGHNYKNLRTTFVMIYKTEGIQQGFFKGLSMNWIKGPIATGISFATYDCVRKFLKDI
ncbi:Mitochondrial carrier protein,Graves disease carrier protein,Mitochondrial carrier domain,Mitochondrial [Cinara cedri]|uniref:Mitochondrial carrier protein,Graves disease carrier protein,Mitochondrial carrier domain,Mitochondrial n=1 Tax=Cinara cedri TaxID=506608 RepID=A0A5E4NFS9_9HEMI|nr:Mitochondrial carrier protein,Graves disease carrier protein,Mitochondrial carrier domain,Mitochondrial [Cinara cedri]